METQRINFKKRIDVRETLSSLPIGEERLINWSDIKATSIRSAVRALREKGYDFSYTERGLINAYKITRLR